MGGIERRVVVSTDSSGVLGTPRDVWQEVWGFMEDYPGFQGYEMIGWGGRLSFWTDSLLSQAEKAGCKVVGIHGRTGGLKDGDNPAEGVVMTFINAFIVPTPELIRHYGSRLEYVLVHSPQMYPDQHFSALEPKNCGPKFGKLYIENNVRREGLSDTVRVVKEIFNHYGIQAGVMFDLCHYVRSLGVGHSVGENWEMAMDKLQELFNLKYGNGKPLGVGIHLPVGLSGDSLPVEEYTADMWKRFKALLDQRPGILVVIENQQLGFRDKVLPSKSSMRKQRERNQRIADLLVKNGII
jgi:hypothetical protein